MISAEFKDVRNSYLRARLRHAPGTVSSPSPRPSPSHAPVRIGTAPVPKSTFFDRKVPSAIRTYERPLFTNPSPSTPYAKHATPETFSPIPVSPIPSNLGGASGISPCPPCTRSGALFPPLSAGHFQQPSITPPPRWIRSPAHEISRWSQPPPCSPPASGRA